MKKLKIRLNIILVGFLVLVIPLLYLCYSLDKLYSSTKERIQENIKSNLLATASELKQNTDPTAYLNIEFSKIHKKLFPEVPEEIIKKYPDKIYFSSLYNKSKFEELLSLTSKKFEPIMVTMSDEALENTFSYMSEELLKQIPSESEKEKLLTEKNNHDYKALEIKYRIFFNRKPDNINHRAKYSKDKQIIQKEKTIYCYKYLSRFNDFDKYLDGVYTDYFGKQVLYGVLKSTSSRLGIHGCYSLIVPQKNIIPDEIIKSAIEEANSNIKIELINSENSLKMEETNEGFNYYINFPTSFINQVKSYQKLNNINKEYFLNKHYKLSESYPDSLIEQQRNNAIIKFISITLITLYLLCSVFLFVNDSKIHIPLTSKLMLILSIIVFLPITGIVFSILLSAKNLDKIVNSNVSKYLHNHLENLQTKNQENNIRMLFSIFEMKKLFPKSHINYKGKTISKLLISNNKYPLSEHDWYSNRLSELIILNGKGDLFQIDKNGLLTVGINGSEEKLNNKYGFLMSKYAENLGLQTFQIPKVGTKDYEKFLKYDMRKTYRLGMLEKYLNSDLEADTAGQEGIRTKDIVNFSHYSHGIYYYTFDADGEKYYIFHKKLDRHDKSYIYIDKYLEKVDNHCLHPRHDYSDIKIGISLNIKSNNSEFQRPNKQDASEDLNRLLQDTKSQQDSIISNLDTTCIKESIFKEGEPFVVGGVAYTYPNNNLAYYLSIILPTLFAYSILLLVVITNFISVFIKLPMNIYKKAISQLENNEYGVTIKSFSKDEFDKITTAFNEMSVALKQKEQIKRYVSDRLIKSINENKIPNAGEGKSEKVTILSSDIRNFTGISERHTPAEIVDMLNSYFTVMQQAITAQDGIIDKYIGDAIQAVFYYAPQKENPILRACKAALEMRKALKELNQSRIDSGLFTIENGIGIDSDIALTGTIGTDEGRKDYTVNGNVIDRAALLESKTKATQTKILISNNSANEISDFIISRTFDDSSMELIDAK